MSAATWIDLPDRSDERGGLVFIEGCRQIPFGIERVYYLYDTRDGIARGGHAHKELEQLLVAVSGRLDVVLDDGIARQRYSLCTPTRGLYVPPMTWRELECFAPGTVCLVLASRYYDESDYIRDYDAFLETTRARA